MSLSDVDRLSNDSEHIYRFISTDSEHHYVYRTKDNNVVNIQTSSDAISIHEITHIRQSLDNGGLIFSTNGILLNAGSYLIGSKRIHTICNMEIEAYRMQYSFDLSFPGKNYGSIEGINIYSIGNIMNSKNQPVYPEIYKYLEFTKNQKKLLQRR